MRLTLSKLYVALVAVSVLAGLLYWLSGSKERVAVEIQSPRDETSRVAVYDQFVVAQTLTLPAPVLVSRLQIPLHVPPTAGPIDVELRQAGQSVSRWTYQPPALAANTLVEADFVLKPLQRLDGQLEVVIDGSQATLATAVQVFVEPAGNNYPDGNYRIARNEKRGDVGLRLFEKQRQTTVLAENWRNDPLALLQSSGQLMLSAIAVAVLPLLALRSARWQQQPATAVDLPRQQ